MNALPTNRAEFEQTTIADWAKYFKVSPSEFETSGSHFIEREHYAVEHVIIAHVNQKTFVQYHPQSAEKILALAKECPPTLSLGAEHLVSYFGNNHIKIECLDHLFYLYPADRIAFNVDAPFHIRQLLADDEAHLDALNNACTKEEVDNSFVAIDELGGWGCFHHEQLVSAAAFSDWGLYGDMGVITHPNFRRQGLAKAVVSAASEHALAVGKLPVYRCHITLFSSINTAKGVGFRPYQTSYFQMDVLHFTE